MPLIRHSMFVLTATILLRQTNMEPSSLVRVCPINHHREQLVSNCLHALMCNEFINCTEVAEAFPGLALIALHRGEWNQMIPFLSRLSSCGIKHNVAHLSEKLPTHFCTLDQTVAVLTVTNFSSEFSQKYIGLKNCTNEHLGEHDDLLKNVLSVCSSIYLLVGKNENHCHENISCATVLKVTTLDENDRLASKNVIRVATYPVTPFVNEHVDEETGKIIYTGLIIEILTKIGDQNHLEFEYSKPPDDQYGSQVNGTDWNGLIGMVQRKEVDVIAADLTVSYPRQKVVDFSVPFYYESFSILIQLPTKNEEKFWRIITLFRPLVWVTILVSLVFASTYIYLLHKLLNDGTQNGFDSVSQTVWYIFSGLVNQGGEIVPRTLSERSFLIFWWIYVLLITSIYSGCLIAIVTKSTIPLPFKNYPGLLNAVANNKYKICLQNNTAFQAQTLVSNDSQSVILRNFFQQHPSYLDTPEGCIKKLLTEPNVAYADQITQLQDIQNQYCLEKSLILLNDFFFSRYFGFAFQKNSSLKDVFSHEILRIIDTGMIPLWKSRHSERPKFCHIVNPTDIISVENEPLKIHEIAGAFILLILGIISSMTYFIGEWHIRRRYKNKTDKTKFETVSNCENKTIISIKF